MIRDRIGVTSFRILHDNEYKKVIFITLTYNNKTILYGGNNRYIPLRRDLDRKYFYNTEFRIEQLAKWSHGLVSPENSQLNWLPINESCNLFNRFLDTYTDRTQVMRYTVTDYVEKKESISKVTVMSDLAYELIAQWIVECKDTIRFEELSLLISAIATSQTQDEKQLFRTIWFDEDYGDYLLDPMVVR